MRTYDFAPLWRSTVGFDRLFDLLNNTQMLEGQDNYPPYDIVRTGEETYRISLADAGLSPDDITVTAQQNLLTVAGRKSQPKQPDHAYLYQGISTREFERRFSLEDHVEVESASFENGLLQINLVRRIPEAMKPRRVQIDAGAKENPQRQGRQGQDHRSHSRRFIGSGATLLFEVAWVPISLKPPPYQKGGGSWNAGGPR